MKIKVLERLDEVITFAAVQDDVFEDSHELREFLDNNNIPYAVGEICEDCGNFAEEGCYQTVYTRSGEGRFVCEDCLETTNYFYCVDCHNWYDDTVRSYQNNWDDTVCEECYYDHYTECSNCGQVLYRDDAYYCDDCDECFCESCWDDHSHNEDLLYDYHGFNDWHCERAANETEPDFYIGHELEIDDGELSSEVVDEITSHIPAVCMHDGSLNYNGIEIVSHPLSLKRYYELEDRYRDLFDKLAHDYNYKSHNTNTCGLHFHVSKPSDEVIDRIILFMETYKDEIITLSRRKIGEIQSWCNFLSDKTMGVDDKTIKSLDYIKKNKSTSNRYMALNLTNYRTIEFRIFKGTLKYETFMADLEFVNNLTEMASNLEIPIEELTWTKVTSEGRFLPQYVEEHNLHSNKPIKDYTPEILIDKIKKIEKTRKELIKLYKEINNRIVAICKIDTRKKVNVDKLIDINKLSSYTTWLQSIIRDLTMLKDPSNYEYLSEYNNRIKYIKERMM